ncbi:DUF7344 domain-containing protein [Natrononativus amylolyticus]|uniref:DUF7344 domain-containing protein n=1 Tax=Natrononativus amylolyticus TaxID=2963434 RepID=UPI0020CE7C1A|nr:hypothetical protein [Natrononativus amylolyticus]
MSYSKLDSLTERSGEERPALSASEYRFSSVRRRRLCAVLASRSPPIALEDLARATAHLESEFENEPPPTVAEVAIALHHHHLPVLSDAGLIEYRPATNVIESTDGITR